MCNFLWRNDRRLKNLEIIFVRHAQSCSNASIEYTDSFHPDDPPLSPLGLKQAELLAEAFPEGGIDRIFSGTLIRTMQTVSPLARKLGLRIELLPDLMEVGTVVSGTDMSLLPTLAPEAVAFYGDVSPTGGSVIPGNETPEKCVVRAKRAMDYIVSRCGDGETVLIATHGAFYGYLVRYVLGISLPETFCWQVDNCSLTRIKLRADGVPKLMTANNCAHLAGLDV